MLKMILVSPSDVIDLTEQETTGLGMQVHAGVTGLGLPSVSTQWQEGAGDGGSFRGSRTLMRDIDLPISLLGANRTHLKQLTSRLALALAGECRLRLVDDNGTSWFALVRRVGGGEFAYGIDTIGERELATVVTLRAGDPYWTAEDSNRATIRKSTARGLLPKLGNLQLSNSQALGVIQLDNPGDASAYPVWRIEGPGTNFRAVSPSGEVLAWNGELIAGESLTIDTRAGTVIDGLGANRYDELAPAPRMWQVPPGAGSAVASLDDPTDESEIIATWRPRSWLVI